MNAVRQQDYDMNSNRLQGLVDELRDQKEDFVLTGWRMFVIEPSIFLSFASALVASSVLLVQLANLSSQ